MAAWLQRAAASIRNLRPWISSSSGFLTRCDDDGPQGGLQLSAVRPCGDDAVSKASFDELLVRLKLPESSRPPASDIGLLCPIVVDRRCQRKCPGHRDHHDGAQSRCE